MRTAIAFTALALLVAPAWAYHQDSTPDLQQSITNVHENHFPHVTGDSHGPERGRGDLYGSVLLDDQPSGHVPHKQGDDSHRTDEVWPGN